LQVGNPQDELGQLAAAFNEAFDRLERSFEQMRRFSADASHELRTPLTALRTMGEVALREERTPAQYREVIASLLEETDRLRHLVESLLTLSRADAGQLRLEPRPTELAPLVREVVEHLSVLAEGPVIAVHQGAATLAAMDEWNTRTHGTSGLTARSLASAVDEASAERATLEFLATHVGPNRSPMCGNSVCQDRRFLARWMPALERYFHYRNLDVSTVKELARRWAPEVAAGVAKESRHTALADVHESIAELRHYRSALFAAPWNAPRA
jgi:oligoribonuclease